MTKKSKIAPDKAGAWIGVGTAIGAAVYANGGEPYWIALGAAIGSFIGWIAHKTQKWFV